MTYTLLPAEEAEKPLFFRLDGEVAERHGAIGYLRCDFGRSGKEFWSTWFDSQKHLKTYPFKTEFDEVINSLRDDGPEPPFASRDSLAAFCAVKPGSDISSRGGGYTIGTRDRSYYFRCLARPGDYDIYCFAYDNRYLLPELAGKHELPAKCFSVLPSSGEMIIITRGENRYVPFASDKATPAETRIAVNDFNDGLGVTRAQEAAMLAGLLKGWDAPAAKPHSYDMNGRMRQPPPKRDEPER